MPGDLERALQAGWRVEVDLVNRRWRYARGSKRNRRWTPYYALDSVPGGAERIRKAQAESERQQQMRRVARAMVC
jgi:hypothetical protein